MISQSILLPLALSFSTTQEIPINHVIYPYEIIDHTTIFHIPSIQQKPRIPLQNLQPPIADIFHQSWMNALAEKRISFDPATDCEQRALITTPLAPQSNAHFVFFYALKRNNKPAPTHYSNASIQERRHTKVLYQNMGELRIPFETVKRKLEEYHIIQASHTNTESYYTWCIGKLPPQEILATFLQQQESTLVKTVWNMFPPDQNPFQSLLDYEQALCFFDSLDQTRTYAIICNRFPLFSHHFILYSTQKDKPQYIASANELMDMLCIQKQLRHQHYSVGFNCNNTAHSQGASSVNVWHWQIAPLGISVDEYTFMTHDQISPLTHIGVLKELSSRHCAFKSNSREDIAHTAYQYIDILHTHNISYNINCGYDACTDQYILVITPRGNWDTVQQTISHSSDTIELDHKPGFAEIIGAFCATTTTLYENVQEFLKNASPQELHQKALFLQKKWLTRACIDEGLYTIMYDEYIQKMKGK